MGLDLGDCKEKGSEDCEAEHGVFRIADGAEGLFVDHLRHL
jgi:hypothetical protein